MRLPRHPRRPTLTRDRYTQRERELQAQAELTRKAIVLWLREHNNAMPYLGYEGQLLPTPKSLILTEGDWQALQKGRVP